MTQAQTEAPRSDALAAARLGHYGVLVGLFQFVPVPFLDDLLQERALRHLVEKLLADHGRTFPTKQAEPLWAGPDSSLLGKAFGFVKGLILKPIKKLLRTVTLVFAVRRAALDGAEAILLGHTLDRLLSAGRLGDDTNPAARRREAVAIRMAVDRAWDNADVQALKAIVRASLRRFREDDKEQAQKQLAGDLETDEARGLFGKFDAAVDGHLASLLG